MSTIPQPSHPVAEGSERRFDPLWYQFLTNLARPACRHGVSLPSGSTGQILLFAETRRTLIELDVVLAGLSPTAGLTLSYGPNRQATTNILYSGIVTDAVQTVNVNADVPPASVVWLEVANGSFDELFASLLYR